MSPLPIIHKTKDVSRSFDCREDKSFFLNILDLSPLNSKSSEGEFCFSSTPLYDSTNHEDVDVHLEFFDHGCRDIFTHSFDHDSDSLTIDLSKLPIFDDPYYDEAETNQAIEAFHPKFMVMSGFHSIEVSSTSNQKPVELPQDAHHSLVHIENQCDLQVSHPPLESHDLITHALEESYIGSHVAKRKFSSFCMFSCFSRSKVCTCL